MSKSSTSGSLLFFFVKFLVFVTVLVWAWWMYGMPAYTKLLAAHCPKILWIVYGQEVEGKAFTWEEATQGEETDLFNTKMLLVWYPEGQDPPHMYIAKLVTNLPPFLALILATPALGLWRRLRVLLVGTTILAATHITFIVYAYRYVASPETAGAGGELPQAASEFLLTLPFLLWIVLAYWGNLSEYFSSTSPPLSEDDIELDGAKLLPDEDAE